MMYLSEDASAVNQPVQIQYHDLKGQDKLLSPNVVRIGEEKSQQSNHNTTLSK